jgi:hypothetical protein
MELEAQLVEAEVAARVQAWVENRVSEALVSEVVQQSLQERLEAERKLLEAQVCGRPAFGLCLISTCSQHACGGTAPVLLQRTQPFASLDRSTKSWSTSAEQLKRKSSVERQPSSSKNWSFKSWSRHGSKWRRQRSGSSKSRRSGRPSGALQNCK